MENGIRMRVKRQIDKLVNRWRRGVRLFFDSPRARALGAVVLFGAMLALTLTGSRAERLDQFGGRADLFAATLVGMFCLFVYAAVSGWLRFLFRHRSVVAVYDERNIIFDLGQAARAAKNVDGLYQLVVDRLAEALGVEHVALFVAESGTGDYVCRVATGNKISVRPAPTLARDAFLVKRLRTLSAPLGLQPSDLDKWERSLGSAHAALQDKRRHECDVLRGLASRLLLQITIKDHLVGFLSLGPRRGEQKFSAADKRMLMSVASQLAFAVENGRLVERMVQDERLTRELALASDVQQRLFPSAAPQSLFLDLAGFCQPAREVGGDYYDFLRFDHGHIGVAVADVAGKGMSAALLMSSLQASLRSYAATQSEAMHAVGAVAQLTAALNRLMCRSTGPASYVTFFYAQFDEETQQLTYVNAGHNPPFVVRRPECVFASDTSNTIASRPRNRAAQIALASGAIAVAIEDVESTSSAIQRSEPSTVFELTTGGPVIGVFQDCVYQQETVQLRSGDLLFAFTDGVTEALNIDGVEFGEQRLRETVCGVAHLSAEEVREAVVSRVRDWRGDAPAHDDLTFVVLKAK